MDPQGAWYAEGRQTGKKEEETPVQGPNYYYYVQLCGDRAAREEGGSSCVVTAGCVVFVYVGCARASPDPSPSDLGHAHLARRPSAIARPLTHLGTAPTEPARVPGRLLRRRELSHSSASFAAPAASTGTGTTTITSSGIITSFTCHPPAAPPAALGRLVRRRELSHPSVSLLQQQQPAAASTGTTTRAITFTLTTFARRPPPAACRPRWTCVARDRHLTHRPRTTCDARLCRRALTRHGDQLAAALRPALSPISSACCPAAATSPAPAAAPPAPAALRRSGPSF